jgi:hypothetical protein
MLIALCVVARMTFTFIPNVQPITTIFLLVALHFSVIDSLIVANATMIVTGLYLGMGPWVLGQMIAYTAVILTFWLLTRVHFLKNLIGLSILALFSGFFYGFVISIYYVQLFQIASFTAYYLAGVSMDVMHALGNVGFMILLIKPFEIFALQIKKKKQK